MLAVLRVSDDPDRARVTCRAESYGPAVHWWEGLFSPVIMRQVGEITRRHNKTTTRIPGPHSEDGVFRFRGESYNTAIRAAARLTNCFHSVRSCRKEILSEPGEPAPWRDPALSEEAVSLPVTLIGENTSSRVCALYDQVGTNHVA
jgi:hypothetical protein